MNTNKLWAAEKTLVAKKFPPISPWWRETVDKFYKSGKQMLVVRVGRRGGKSSTLCRLAVAEALYGEHKIPPGDVGVVALISVSKDEANSRLRTIKEILDALKVTYSPIDGGIELDHMPVAFKTYAATNSGVRGFTCIAAICDEVASWKDGATNANPATEVLNSLMPTTATMPTAKIFLSSSPIGLQDAHAEAFARGDDEGQMVAQAASWISNPTLTEAACLKIAKNDQRVFAREFLAMPQGSALAAFDPDAIEDAFREVGLLEHLGAPVVATDPAGRGSDSWSFFAAGWGVAAAEEQDGWLKADVLGPNGIVVAEKALYLQDAEGHYIPDPNFHRAGPILYISSLHVADASYRSEHKTEDIVAGIELVARAHGARILLSDQLMAPALEALASQRGLILRDYTWTAQNKAQAVTRLRTYLNERRIVIDRNDPLAAQFKSELGSFEEVIGKNGMSYGGRDKSGGHFDLVSALITLMMAEVDGVLIGAPWRKRNWSVSTGPGDYANA